MAQTQKPTVNIPNMPSVPTDSESVISMILGAMVVVVIGALLFSYVRDWRASRNKPAETAELNQEATPEPMIVEELPTEVKTEASEDGKQVPANLPAKYVVKAGDSTWKIAQAFYGSGFNYVDIEAANGLKADQEVAVGAELIIPKVAVRTKDQAGTPSEYTATTAPAPKATPGLEKGDDSEAQKAME